MLAIPLIVFPLVGFGRSVRKRAREAQDKLAKASAYASEAIGAIRTVQAFNNTGQANDRFAEAAENAFKAARASTRQRAWLTGFAITMVFGSVVAVLWFGAQGVLAGTITAGTLSQFLIYSIMSAGSLAALSEVWSELSQASGAASRLIELLGEKPGIAAPEHPLALPKPPVGKVEFDHVRFAYPTRPGASALDGLNLAVNPGETGGDRRVLGRRQEHDLLADPALLRSRFRPRADRWRRYQAGRSGRSPRPHRHRAAGRDDLRRLDPREHRLRRAGRGPFRGRGSGPRGPCRGVHPQARPGL